MQSISNPKNLGRLSLQKLASKRVLETARKDPIGHYLDERRKTKKMCCMQNKCEETIWQM